jgi:Uma2 family endonuclease
MTAVFATQIELEAREQPGSVAPKSWLVQRLQERIDDYLSFGVRYVWLIHPRTRRAFVYTSERLLEVKDGVLRTDGLDICVPLAELE